MKYFDSNMVNFAEINNIGDNVTYIRTTPFSAILWRFRAQTILWRRQFQREIYSYAIIYLSLFKHLRLSWLPLFFEAPHIRIFNKVSSSGLTVRLCLLCFYVYEIWILIMFPLSSVKWYKFTKIVSNGPVRENIWEMYKMLLYVYFVCKIC